MAGAGGQRDERGVSEVISVLLMVSVTIVLAAMVGSVLLDVVSDVNETPIAGTSVDFDGENGQIRVTYTATQRKGTAVDVRLLNASGGQIDGGTLEEVGESITFAPGPGDYTVKVVATAPDGQQAVVLNREGSI